MIVEVFDSDYDEYQESLVKADQEAVEDETLDCDGWKTSSCCDAAFWNDTDVCSECLEHSSVSCDGCDQYNECNNDNKINI
jgi:hypothetical protein